MVITICNAEIMSILLKVSLLFCFSTPQKTILESEKDIKQNNEHSQSMYEFGLEQCVVSLPHLKWHKHTLSADSAFCTDLYGHRNSLIISKLSVNLIILLQLYDNSVFYKSLHRPYPISGPNSTTCKIYRQRRKCGLEACHW